MIAYDYVAIIFSRLEEKGGKEEGIKPLQGENILYPEQIHWCYKTFEVKNVKYKIWVEMGLNKFSH